LNKRQRKVLELLDSHGERLHALIAKLTQSQDITGDLMQELFIRLSNSRSFDKARDSFAYAYRTAMNVAFDWRRRSKPRSQPLNDDCTVIANRPSVMAEMVKAEELEEVLDAMAKLSDLGRDVVVMHYIEQEPYEQVANRLGKNPQHVRSVSSKAIARLRELLTGPKTSPSGKEKHYD
jgi:RNA polymerase sigma factor (sigma-70 family)